MLNISGVIGGLCIWVVVTHQSQPNCPLKILEQQLTLNSCSIDSINSVASSGVTVEFSLAERSGEVPHGTTATFKALTCGDRLVGAEHVTCYDGVWNDLSQCTSSCKPSINFNIILCGCNGNDRYSYSPPIHEWSSGDYICFFNNFLLWLLVWLVVLLWHTASWRDGPPMNIQHLTSQKVLYMKKCHSQRHQRKKYLKWETMLHMVQSDISC